MTGKAWQSGVLAVGLAIAVVGSIAPVAGQKKPVVPPGKSAEVVKELGALLEAKKLRHFAASDPAATTHYVAILFTPGIQVMLVSATFTGTDIDYYLYQRDYSSAFSQLRASPSATERVFVEDVDANGLVPQPPKGAVADEVTFGTTKRSFSGDFSDTRVVNTSKLSLEEYTKQFADADAKYVQALGVLIAALKK